MANSNWFSVHFEAVSIQEYIFAGAKLKDMVFASELVDRLCSQPLLDAIEVLGLTEVESLPKTEVEIAFPRKAGGAFIAVLKSEDLAKRLVALWSIAVTEFAPGLKYTLSLANSTDKLVDAIKEGIEQQKHQRNVLAPTLPETTPIMERSPRTGLFVVKHDRHNPQQQTESLDLSTLVKRQLKDQSLGIDKKFLGQKSSDYVLPTCIDHSGSQDCGKQDAFPFNNQKGQVSGEHYVGLIHADGNGLGEFLHQFFIDLKDKNDNEYYQAYLKFTQGLEAATQKAAQFATQQVLQAHQSFGVLPMRPIILGGDDLTVICRADCAFEFCRVFIESFEQETQQMMKSLPVKVNASKFTACAGIAFVKSNQPFYMASHLAESLCDSAKKQSRAANAKVIPSSLAFHHVTNSLFEDAQTALKQELQAVHDQSNESEDQPTTYQFTMGAYQIAGQADEQLPQWQHLQALADCFGEEQGKLGIATLRNLATWMHADLIRAQEVYNRWHEVSLDRDEPAWESFENALRPMGLSVEKLPFTPKRDENDQSIRKSPISDVIALTKMTAQGV